MKRKNFVKTAVNILAVLFIISQTLFANPIENYSNPEEKYMDIHAGRWSKPSIVVDEELLNKLKGNDQSEDESKKNLEGEDKSEGQAGFSKMKENLKESLKDLADAVSKAPADSGITDAMKEKLDTITNAVGEFITDVSIELDEEGEISTESFEEYGELLDSIEEFTDTVADFIDNSESYAQMKNDLDDSLDDVSDKLQDITEKSGDEDVTGSFTAEFDKLQKMGAEFLKATEKGLSKTGKVGADTRKMFGDLMRKVDDFKVQLSNLQRRKGDYQDMDLQNIKYESKLDIFSDSEDNDEDQEENGEDSNDNQKHVVSDPKLLENMQTVSQDAKNMLPEEKKQEKKKRKKQDFVKKIQRLRKKLHEKKKNNPESLNPLNMAKNLWNKMKNRKKKKPQEQHQNNTEGEKIRKHAPQEPEAQDTRKADTGFSAAVKAPDDIDSQPDESRPEAATEQDISEASDMLGIKPVFTEQSVSQYEDTDEDNEDCTRKTEQTRFYDGDMNCIGTKTEELELQGNEPVSKTVIWENEKGDSVSFQSEEIKPAAESPSYAEGRLIVSFEDGVTGEARAGILEALGDLGCSVEYEYKIIPCVVISFDADTADTMLMKKKVQDLEGVSNVDLDELVSINMPSTN